MNILGFELKKIEKVPLPTITANKPTGVASVLPIKQGDLYNAGTVTWQGQNAESQVKSGYSGNDIVYSIIRLIVDKVKMAPWAEYTIKDETSYKRYNAMIKRPDLIQDWGMVNDLRQKSITLVPTKSKISDLLDAPNENDSWGDLVEAYSTFKLITGNAYVYGNTIPSGNNAGKPLELYVLPSQYMQILADLSVFPIKPKSYQLYMQFIEQFTKQQILHDKYFNPNWNIVGNQLYGLSPLQAAAKVLTRSNEGKQLALL